MADWNPALYRRFESERTRPAPEKLARVRLAEARERIAAAHPPRADSRRLLGFPRLCVVAQRAA